MAASLLTGPAAIDSFKKNQEQGIKNQDMKLKTKGEERLTPFYLDSWLLALDSCLLALK
jgi:hypothetical protein